MENIKNHLTFLSNLTKSSVSEFKHLIEKASKSRINAICEILLNILSGNIHSSDSDINKLSKHKRVLRKLSQKKNSVDIRRNSITRNAKFIMEILTSFLPKLSHKLSEWEQSQQSSDIDSDN